MYGSLYDKVIHIIISFQVCLIGKLNSDQCRIWDEVCINWIVIVLCLTIHNTGYVPLPTTKIDFSSDLEKADPNQKKKKKRVTKIVAFIPSLLVENFK